MSRGSKGFTLVEALVATTLAAIGVVGAVGGLGSLSRAQADLQERERMQRLAVAKYDELITQGIASAPSEGDFEEWQEDRYEWEAAVQPSGIENLDSLRVLVRRTDGNGSEAAVEGMVFTPPVSTEGDQAGQGGQP